MTPDRRKFVVRFSVIFCAMFTCLFFSLRHGPHHAAFGFAFYGLSLITTWQNIRYNLKHRRQRDTLIHLFPVPPETFKERS
jgi:hypothetical protein